MARIIGVPEGFTPGSVKHPERKVNRAPDRASCKLCGGLIEQKKRGTFNQLLDEDRDGACIHCAKLFGIGLPADPFGASNGVTNLRAEECIKRIDALREMQWGIILRAGSFGTECGQIVIVEPGDIVKIHRAGLADTSSDALEYCSHARSKERFSVTIMIGPLPLVLWPHEISAVSFLTIMDLKKAGEIEESFVAQEDECGYFKPRDDLRGEIYQCFGRMTGVPPR
jgi:hypothetical protein